MFEEAPGHIRLQGLSTGKLKIFAFFVCLLYCLLASGEVGGGMMSILGGVQTPAFTSYLAEQEGRYH